MSIELTTPIVPAYHRDQSYYVWCEGCFTWHLHGASNGSRIAHCHREDTPYRETGYDLKYAGELTDKIEREHGVIPADLRPLSDEQLRCLLIVYSEVCHIGQRGRDAWRLLHVLEINQLASNIPGDHLSARVTYLRWQLARTSGVHARKTTPPRFLFEQEKPLIMSGPELMNVVFPEDRRVTEVWMQEAIESVSSDDEYLPVWFAWDMFKAWMHRKGPDYKTARADWLKDLADNGLVPRKVDYYGGQVFEGYRLIGDESLFTERPRIV